MIDANDIERLADIISPKGNTRPFDEPLHKEIFKARDIEDMDKRKKYLLQLISKEKAFEGKEVYIKQPTISITTKQGAKDLPLPKRVKRKPNKLLIYQCEKELSNVEDLIYIEQMVKEYSEITGNNEKEHYRLYAIEGHTNNRYRKPEYYEPDIFSEIVNTIFEAMDNPYTQPVNDAKDIQNNIPLLQWNISITTLATLFYDLIEKNVITWAGETKGKTIEETNGIKIKVARMLCSYFIDKEGNKLNIDTITQTLKPTTPKAKKRINIDNVLPKKKR